MSVQLSFTSAAMETHIGIISLPTEVLDKIFSYLTFYDVKSVKRVCRRWLDITLHSSYTKHNKINIRNFNFLPPTLKRKHDSNDDESTIGLSFIYQTVQFNFKDYAHSDEYYDEFERGVKLFMKFNGKNVKNLTLADFDATKEPRLFQLSGEIVDAAPNLEKLCLKNSQFDRRLFLNGRGETNRGSRNLKHFSLAPWSVRSVGYDELKYLAINCTKLHGLTWLTVDIFFDDKLVAFFKSMSRRLNKLKIDNTVAEELVRENNFPILSDFQLVSLDLKFTTIMVPSDIFTNIVEFIKKQRHTLTDLTIYCSDKMMLHLRGIYNVLHKLERLKIVYDGADVVDLTSFLSQPRELKVLEIYVKMTNDFSSVQPSQNKLKLLNCNVFANSQFLNVINNFTNLVALRVTLFTLPTSASLSTFYSSLSQLKYIYLEIAQKYVSNSNKSDFDTPLKYNISHLKRLECLGISTKENIHLPGCEFEHIAKLKCLQKLICKVREKASDALFDEFFENSKCLNYLDVRQSHGIDDEAVEKIFENLNHLCHIAFAGCSNIRDSNAALDRMKIINNRVKYSNNFPQDFDEEFVSKYVSL